MATPNNNFLHNHVLTKLFKEAFLVDLSAPKEDAPPDSTNHLLEVIVFHHYETNQLPTNQQALLDAILMACKLNPTAVKQVSKSDISSTPLNEILEKHQPKKVILFGLDPASIGLPIHFPVFQVQLYQQVQYLHAPNLAELENDKQLKLALWQKLKQLFP